MFIRMKTLGIYNLQPEMTANKSPKPAIDMTWDIDIVFAVRTALICNIGPKAGLSL
jgi:hypothetical protein